MASDAEREAMQRALAPARPLRACHEAPIPASVRWCSTPTVGEVGEGFHRGAGSPHAEVEALAAAGDAARGGTVVVTLEPCHHQGRTGPCTQALLDAGVARVVFGQPDPNPRRPRRRRGAPRRRASTSRAVCWRPRRAAQPGLVVRDGARPSAASPGRSRRPSTAGWRRPTARAGGSAGPRHAREVHRLRAEVDAVVVGTGTALVDDPQLTARDADGVPAAPTSRSASSSGTARCRRPSRVLDDAAPTRSGRPLTTSKRLLTSLFDRDVHHVLLEGGPTLAAAFLRAGLVDRVVGYVAPALLGDGPPLHRRPRRGHELGDADAVSSSTTSAASAPTSAGRRSCHPARATRFEGDD